MKRPRIIFGIVSLTALGLFIAILFAIKADLAHEGFGNWVGVRNYLLRDGQIKVVLQGDKTVTGVTCSDSEDTDIDGSTAIVKVGYTWCSTEVTYLDSTNEPKTVTFDTQKLNNWNRVSYIEQEDGTFLRFDNGIELPHHDQITQEQ